MYGHALNLFSQCAFKNCTRPGTVTESGKTICARHALTIETMRKAAHV